MASSGFDQNKDEKIVLVTAVGEVWIEGGVVYRRAEANGEPVVIAMSEEIARDTVCALAAALSITLGSSMNGSAGH